MWNTATQMLLGCGGVGVGVADPHDEAVRAEAASGRRSSGWLCSPPEQCGDEPARALVGETADGMGNTAEGAGQGHCALVPETEGSGSVAISHVGRTTYKGRP